MNMKETKTFFEQDNKLNKGYSKGDFNQRQSDNNLYRKKFEYVLPPIDVINEYEHLYPGTLERLIDLTEQEQHHRHSVDLVGIESYNRASKFGRICALIFVGLICFTTIILVMTGAILGAIIFSGLAFLSLSIASIMSFFRINKRRDYQGKPGTVPYYNKYHRNNSGRSVQKIPG